MRKRLHMRLHSHGCVQVNVCAGWEGLIPHRASESSPAYVKCYWCGYRGRVSSCPNAPAASAWARQMDREIRDTWEQDGCLGEKPKLTSHPEFDQMISYGHYELRVRDKEEPECVNMEEWEHASAEVAMHSAPASASSAGPAASQGAAPEGLSPSAGSSGHWWDKGQQGYSSKTSQSRDAPAAPHPRLHRLSGM